MAQAPQNPFADEPSQDGSTVSGPTTLRPINDDGSTDGPTSLRPISDDGTTEAPQQLRAISDQGDDSFLGDMSHVAGATPGMQSPMQAGAARPVQPVEKQGVFDAIVGNGEAPQNSAEQTFQAQQNEDAAGNITGNDPALAAQKEQLASYFGGLDQKPVESAVRSVPVVGDLAAGGYHALRGATGVAENQADLLANPKNPNNKADDALKPLTEAAGGAMDLTMPAFGVAGMLSPVKTAAMYFTAIAAGEGAQKVAQRLGMSPVQQNFANVVGTFIPIAFHAVTQLQAGVGDTVAKVRDADGNVREVPIKAAAATGRGFSFGVGKGEDGSVFAAGRVGPFSARAKWGGSPEGAPPPAVDQPARPSGPVRGLLPAEGVDPTANLGRTPQAPLDPVEMLANDRADAIQGAAIRADEIQQKAEDLAAGVPPPSVPLPEGMDDGAITPQTSGLIARAIQMLPENLRPQAILESVGNLAKWMFGKKTIIGPDGMVTSVDTPESAQKQAVKLVNGEIERQNQAKQQAAEQQQKQAEQQQEDAETARTEREESLEPQKPSKTEAAAPKVEIPDNPHTQLARRILSSLPDNTPAAKMDQALRDKIVLQTSIRKALVAEEVQRRASEQEAHANEVMTGEPTPEGQKPHEIEKWVQDVKDGGEPFAHIQKSTTYRPKDTTGLSRTTVKGAGEADGIYFHDSSISGADIREGARKGTLDQLREQWKAGKAAKAEEGSAPAPQEESETKPETAPAEPQQELTPYEGDEGKRTNLLLSDGSSIPTVHRMVELSSLNPSHDGISFQPSRLFPPGANERSYDKSKAEQNKVIQHEQEFEPSYIVNTNPDAVNGPPVVASKPFTIDGVTYPAGTVFGGTSRVMTLQRVYTNGAEAPYREALLENHRSFGFPPEVQEKFNQPVGVREIEPPQTLEEMHRLMSLLNKPPTQSLDKFDQAVSIGKQLSPDTLNGIADLIRQASDRDSTATLNAVLSDKTLGKHVVKMLRSDGIITDTNEGQFVDPSTALLTAAARTQLGDALLANLLDDRKLMEDTPYVLKQKLIGSIGSIAAITSTDDGWNLGPAMKEAAKRYGDLSRMPHPTIEDAMSQSNMLEQRGPVLDALIRQYDKNVGEVRKAFSMFTTGAMEGRNQSGLLGITAVPEPYLDFNFAFGTELTKEQFEEEMAKLRGGETAPVDGITQTESSQDEDLKAKIEANRKRLANLEEKWKAALDRAISRGEVRGPQDLETVPELEAIADLKRTIAKENTALRQEQWERDLAKIEFTPEEYKSFTAPFFDATQHMPMDNKTTIERSLRLFGGSSIGSNGISGDKALAMAQRAKAEGLLKAANDHEYITHDYTITADATPESIAKNIERYREQWQQKKGSIEPLKAAYDKLVQEGAGEQRTEKARLAYESARRWEYMSRRNARQWAEEYERVTGQKYKGVLPEPVGPRDQKEDDFFKLEEQEQPQLDLQPQPEPETAIQPSTQGEVLPPAAKPEIRPIKKGDQVIYTTNAGKERPGTVAFADDRIVRIRDARTGTVITKKRADVRHADHWQNPAPSMDAAEPPKIEPVKEQPQLEAPKAEVSEEETLVDRLNLLFDQFKGPKNYNDLKAIVREFDGKEPDQLRMKQAQEAYETMLTRIAEKIISKNGAHEAFNSMVRVYEGQPNLAIRTSTSIQNQAYSTPMPLAYIADRFAGVSHKTSTYEPTAGNGMLLMQANPALTIANEIEPTRIANLKGEGFAVTTFDATQWMPAQQFDSIVTNPPFGSLPAPIKFDGYEINKLDHLIALKALSVMKDDGKATIIIGATKEPGEVAAKDKPFFNYLYSHYNVVRDFELDGDLYSRQGASWPVRVIAIDGRARSANVLPRASLIPRLTTWEEVYEHAAEHLGANLEGRRRADNELVSEVRGESPDAKPVPAASGTGNSIPDIDRQETSPGGYTGSIGSGQPGPIVHTGGVPEPRVGNPDNAVASDGDVAASDRLAEDQPRPKAVRREPARSVGNSADAPVIADENSNQFQAVYTPYSEKKDVNVLAPKGMVHAMHSAMERLSAEVGDLDQYVTDELGYSSIEEMQKAYMGLQVDTIAAEINAVRKGKGVIIADQTGVGKGRQAAAIIRFCELNGITPIFVTAKPNLFSDMYSDLHDIGSGNAITPLLLNMDAKITHPVTGQKILGNKKNEHGKAMQRILETGKLPEGRNALFLTYSQINKPNRQQQILQRLAPNSIFILDEAHKAGGESNTGLFMRSVLAQAKAATFLSATYAKRPDNLPLYADMTSISLAIPDKEKIVSAIEAGGAPLQAIVSYQLAQAGELFRRERSYDGITFSTHVFDNRREEHERTSDAVTEVLRAIVAADEAYHNDDFQDIVDDVEEQGGTAMEGGNQASTTVNHANFTSVVHNAVKQMLLGLKADDVADQIIADIRAGIKPIIALESTMGSFLTHYVESNGLQKGAPLHNFNYGTVLKRSLDRTRYYSLKNDKGEVTRVEVPLEDLKESTRALYLYAENLIKSLKVSIPVSPIDWIKHRVKQAGHTIAEVTGRDHAIDYSREVPVLSSVDDIERKDRVATINGFNNGGIDAMILNQAGSTGLSAHASEKFADRRPRRMYIVQPQGDINEQMQILGRINRTGQVVLPSYTTAATALPAEIRPAMVLSTKLKSLNANTTSNTRSNVQIESPDMINKYGDQVVKQYLADNPEMATDLRLDAGEDDDDDAADENLARKATGRAALLPVAQQKEFFAAITESYKDLIKYLDDTGQNDLEPKTYDFDAEPIGNPQIVYQGTDKSNPFGQDAYFGEYRIKRQGKPYTADEVREMIKDGLQGERNGADHYRKLTSELDKKYDAFLAKQTTGSARERAIQTRQGSMGVMSTYRVGAGVRVEINGETYNAAVVGIEPAKSPKGNPYAISSIKFELAVNSPVRSIKIPGTEFQKITIGPLGTQPDINYLFHDPNPNARMIARIITGNMLGAYGALQGPNSKGRVVSFTMKDGSHAVGMLMPSRFDPRANVSNDYCLRTAEGVEKTVNAYHGSGPAVQAPGGDILIQREGPGIIIKTKLSKAVGGKFFNDKNLLAHIDQGNFYSRNGMMVGHVIPGHERQAIQIIMGKIALYATNAMTNQAREFDQAAAQTPPPLPPSPPSGGRSLRDTLMDEEGSVDVDKAAAYIQNAVPATWDEITRAAKASGMSAKKIGREVLAAFTPTLLADSDMLDIMGTATGEPKLRIFEATQLMRGVDKMFKGMSQEQQVEFVDRWQNGRKQPSTDLQNAQELMQSILEAQRAREIEATNLGRPEDKQIDLTQKENYFPNRYSKPPSNELIPTEEEQVLRLFSRRPFSGSKAFLKQQKYTLKEAVAKNAVPLGTPVQMILKRMEEGAKYVSAKTLYYQGKEAGLITFVRNGKNAPEKYEEINDRSSVVMRRIIDEEGYEHSIQTGKWYAQRDFARLFNNYLSVDHIRGTEIGRAFVAAKTAATAMRMAFSMFHYLNIGLETISSGVQLGGDQFYNQGVRNLDPTKITAGLADIGRAICAPGSMWMEGRKALKYIRTPDEFLATPEGQKWARSNPDFPRQLQRLFGGGLRMDMGEDFRDESGKGFVQAMKEGRLGSGFLKAVPWLAHLVAEPLFKHYIPIVKLAFACQLLSLKDEQYAQALAAGTITEETIAREVAATVDNRFGEFNWDSLYLNNTLRTAINLVFRAPGWHTGSWRMAGTAIDELIRHGHDDRLFDKIDQESDKWSWAREQTRKLPQLGNNTGGILAMAFTVAVLGTVASKLTTHKWPWELAEESTSGIPKFVRSALECLHPSTGVSDEHGQPIRFNFPTGLKVYEQAGEDPMRYFRGTLADWLAGASDTAMNRDSRNNYVYDPQGTAGKKFLEGLAYNLKANGVPFFVDNAQKNYGKPEPPAMKVARAAGVIGGAPRRMDESSALAHALTYVHHEPHTPDQEEAYQLAQHQAPTRYQVLRAAREKNFTYLEKVVLHDLTYQQAKEIYDKYATPQEQQQLRPIIERKRTLEILRARRHGKPM